MNDKKYNESLYMIFVITTFFAIELTLTGLFLPILASAQETNGQITKGNIVKGEINAGNITNGIVKNNTINNGEMVGTNITGATINNADLNISNNGTLTLQNDSKPSVAQIEGGKINAAAITNGIMTNGKVTDANVSNGKMSGVNITDADIIGAELTGANVNEIKVKSGNDTTNTGEKDQKTEFDETIEKINPFK
jgi:uncharacterized protein YjbI with pentapeptide repeats